LRQLIVTADDFGAAREVNEAVEAAHRRGILTAASLMVSGSAAADAIARARRMPSLRVGLHLVLVDGRPVLPASAVSQLVNADGAFRSDMASVGALISLSSKARRQAAAEITAQFEAFRATTLQLDHCNAHKHFHLHPVIASLMISIGARFGLESVRVPLEPASLPGEIERCRPSMPSVTLPFALLLRRRVRGAGLFAPDRTFGLRWSGRMTRDRLAGLIRQLPSGVSEIYLHPATGSYAGAARAYRYREEFDALMAPDVAAACRASRVQLGGFGDFLRPRAAGTLRGLGPEIRP
jgi:hopanoid biosynthesis associated protein HpnK